MKIRQIMEYKGAVLFFGFLQILVGISALIGGYFLLAQNGLTSAMVSEAIYETNPAATYFWSAMGMVFLIGLPFLVASWMTIRRVKFFGLIGLLLGILLISWNYAHITTFGLFSIVQPLFMLFGLIAISMGLFFMTRLEQEDYRTFKPILR